MSTFDASTAISSEFGIFGIPLSEKDSKVILLPVPWEVTTSYGSGASDGPQIIRAASEQIDLFDFETKKAYEAGYHMLPFPEALKKRNDEFKALAQEVIELRTQQSDDRARIEQLVRQVNAGCAEMTAWVLQESRRILSEGKILGLVGGDHSCPLGSIRAVSEKYGGNVGVLHIDAHADLRHSYQGFEQSHASIMHNVMTGENKPKTLVQIGIRDFCEEEYHFIESRPDIKTFFDLDVKQRLLEGETWASVCQDVMRSLPHNVYVSFDIDGLDPAFCPNTGTPVPGGLSIDQAFYLLAQIHRSGKRLVGFDLNEVSSGGLSEREAEWDDNVGARLLYKLCGWAVVTENH